MLSENAPVDEFFCYAQDGHMNGNPKRTILALLLALTCAGCSSENSKKASVQAPPATEVNSSNGLGDKLSVLAFETTTSSSLLRKRLESNDASTGTRFVQVDDSGIGFTNTFPRKRPNRLIETGAGVAIADYDGDGEADVYLLATEGPNKLFRGLGNFKFEDVTDTAGVDGTVDGKPAWGAGASFADVDNDGDLDLLVCNMGSRDLLYINQGDGTFSEEAKLRGVTDADASKIGSFCDFDLDGDLDLYVLTYKAAEDYREPETLTADGRIYIHPDFRNSFGFVHGQIMEAGQQDFLYRNDGKGFFKEITGDARIIDYAMGLGVSWLDYNDDGYPDIYVANDFWQADRLFRNVGDGTFVDELPNAAKHVPWFSMGSDSGDLNNDGLVDLMVGEMSGTTHFRQKMNMGSMENSTWFLKLGAPRQAMRNAVYVNSGADRFMEVAHMTGLASTNWTWATRLVDLNNDGLLDVFITNGNARDRLNGDIANELMELSKAGRTEKLSEAIREVPELREKNLAFLNQGNLKFEDVSKDWGLDHEGISHGVAMADFDHDGDLDMVVNNLYEPATVYRNDSGDGNRITVSLRSEDGNSFGFGARVEVRHGQTTQTKHLTPVRGYISSDQPIVHFGLGDATNIETMQVTWPGGATQSFENLETGFQYLIVKNADASNEGNNGQQALKTAFSEPESASFEFTHVDGEHDDFARQPLLPYQTSRLGPGVAVGDINDDGLPDVFIGSGNDHPGALLVNRGGFVFEKISGPWTRHFLQDDMSALFFDANGDGFLDLLVTSGGSEYSVGNKQLRDRLYLNRQQETFEFIEDALPKNAVSSSTAATLDYDHDGDLDLVIGSRSIPHQYPMAAPTQILRNEGGTFVEVGWKVAKPLKEIGIVNSILCSDFDGDGWTDLVLATEWGPVRFLKNEKGKFSDVTEQLGLSQYSGWWRGLAAGDFDSDGDMDYVATNQGTNTKYQADSEHPHRLYFGDFDESGRIDLIEAEYEGDIEYPVRGRSCSTRAMPMVGKKFKSFESFALAPLDEIYDFNETNHQVKEVNFLESAILWNEGDGMRVEPLPRMAQTSPGFGVEAFDHDCDGDVDILIANNFFGAEPETGYMDGGLGALLENKGGGRFEFVWPNRSGVLLENDSMGLAIADFDSDGDLDSVVGVHADKARLLENGANPRTFRRLSIIGPDGNTRSIGATVIVTLEDGTKQRHEVHLGGSYLSQSTNAIFLYTDKLASLEVTWPTGEKAVLGRSEIDALGDGEIEIDVASYR